MWLELGDNIPPRLVTTILNALFLASLARLVIVLVCCADILLPTAYTLIYQGRGTSHLDLNNPSLVHPLYSIPGL